MYYLIADRTYEGDYPGIFARSCQMRGNDDYLVTSWAFCLFSGVNLSDANLLSAIPAVEFYLERLIRDNSNTFALGAFDLPARELVAGIDSFTA